MEELVKDLQQEGLVRTSEGPREGRRAKCVFVLRTLMTEGAARPLMMSLSFAITLDSPLGAGGPVALDERWLERLRVDLKK